MSSNPHFFLPFYLPAYDGRLGHFFFDISIPYAVHVCIHAFVLHTLGSVHHTNRIRIFKFQIEYMNQLVASHKPYLG